MVPEISVQRLKEMIDNKEEFQLIDVREPNEYAIAHLNGTLIPLGSIPASVEKIDRDKTVVIHCRAGGRSAQAVDFLQRTHGFDNLVNLAGGILAWAEHIDPSMPKA